MTFALPQRPDDWERVLCRHFLRSADEDATPIRSFEVTRHTLAESCGGDPAGDADLVVAAFRDAFDSDAAIRALEHGSYRAMRREGLPGCFGYLALTLLIDSLLDEEIVELGAFRAKLRQFLRTDRSFSNLSGVASMWRELAAWLDARVTAGEPFRRLELPPIPPSWTHIGFTLRLSFPSRRDRRLLNNFFDQHPDALHHPRSFLNEFRRLAESDKASWGMKTAFQEFHGEFLAGHRALASHRFWQFVQTLAAGKSSPTASTEVAIQIVRDQDDEWLVQLQNSASGGTGDSSSLGAAVDEAARGGPNLLSPSISRGYLLFRQVGAATWRAAPDFSECVGRIFVGLSPHAASRVGGRLGQLVESGTWRISADPVGVSITESVLRSLFGGGGDDAIYGASLYGGVRNGSSWLGRSKFLPFLSADETVIEVRGEESSEGQVRCIEEATARGVYRLKSTGRIDGKFTLTPSDAGQTQARWAKRVSFVSDAYVHEELHASPGIALGEWPLDEDSIPPPQAFGTRWDDCSEDVEDLIEAVYAGGNGSWSDSDLVPIVREWAGPNRNPWDVLRWLQDSKIVAPALRPRWRGRIWWLVRPTLVAWTAEKIAIVDGCLPARLISDFLRAAEGANGTAFRTCSGPYAIPIYGCLGADPHLLSSRLGWPLGAPQAALRRKLAFQTTTRRTDGYVIASTWDWEAGRFRSGSPSGPSKVVLTRWRQIGARDHDVYEVAVGARTRRFLSRNAAIAEAHCAARRRLFRAEQGRILRIATEGALPDAVAWDLRYRSLNNPGLSATGEYFYTANHGLLTEIFTMLPNIVEDLKDSSGCFGHPAVSLVQHTGGRVRATWKAGRLSTDRSR